MFIQIIFFSKEVHLNSGVRLLLELYCVIVIKPVAFFTICAILTCYSHARVSYRLFYNSVFGCGCGFGFEQSLWRIRDGFGGKKARIGGFVYPYSRPSLNSRFTENKISQSRIKRILLYDPLEGPEHHTSSDQSPPRGGTPL